MKTLIQTLFISLLLITGQAFAAGSISVTELAKQIQTDKAPTIIDVRTEQEYQAGHLPGAMLIPHNQVSNYLASLAGMQEEPIVLYCRSGKRAGMASKVLEASGFTQIQLLEGSYQAWSAAGQQTVK